MSRDFWYPPGSSSSSSITANQGSPGSDANGWPVKITDGIDEAQVSAAGALIVDGSASIQPVSGPLTDTQLRASKVPVSISTTSGAALTAAGVAGALDVYINNPSVPVKGNGVDGTAATLNSLLIAGSDGATQRNIKTSATGVVIVDGSASTQPISGTVAATQSGIWTVQPGNTANTTAWKVDGSAVTQPVSGTFFQATQPISAVSLPLPIGAALESTQSAQSVLVGAVTETAPATDTASSGLNGRLQRVAQRITSLIAQIPAALGQTTMASSMSVAIASNQSAVPVTLTSTTVTGTVAVTESGTWTVQPGNTANTTAWLVTQDRVSTATCTNVASSASSVSLLASTAGRKNATFFNDSTAVAYLKLGTTASTSSYTVQIASLGYYELPLGRIYTGAIDCIWASANGNMRITELT